MCRRMIYLILLVASFAGAANAQFITSVAHRNTDTDAPEQPQIAPNPLAENSVTFVDRTHVYADIPEFILGAQYLMLANDNKNMSAYEVDMTFAMNATLYVFVDNRMGGAAGGKGVNPNIDGMPWLNDMGFVDTGEDIGIDESFDGGINQYFSIYALSVTVGTITIYGNTEGHGGNMLGVAALGPKLSAYYPEPQDGAIYPETWASLGWTAGDTAASHDVYFSDNFDDVNDGTGDAFRGNQTSVYFVVGFVGFPYPDGLVPGTTYYWRIDEIEADGTMLHRGLVWSFTVPPKTAYAPDPVDNAESIDPDAKLSWTAGFGSKLHTVYFGDNFDDVNNADGGLPQGSATYTPGTLKMAKTYYWRVDEFDIAETYKGDVWSFTTEGAVGNPSPAKGAVDVTQTPVLTWAPGFGASHEIYFGADATSLEYKGSGNLGSESFEPGQLEWDTTYYWRIDEANSANADSPWTGILWSFTTANFLIIDDFESYNDIDPPNPVSNRVFEAWLDGYEIPTNGALVGNELPPYAEQSIVHSGIQSMPLYYDNSVGNSEATHTLTYPRDWTEKGVNKLTIWFRGDSANAAETLYVALNGSAVVNHDNPNAAQIGTWTAWNIDLQAFADQGVNLANVNTIALGLGNRNNPLAGGSGTMYFDDIRLYPPPPEPAP